MEYGSKGEGGKWEVSSQVVCKQKGFFAQAHKLKEPKNLITTKSTTIGAFLFGGSGT